MCGRFVLATPPGDLAERFDAREAPSLFDSYQPSYNVAPTDPVLALAVSAGGERVLDRYRWGLIPGWAQDASIGSRLINARAESLSTSRAFKTAFLNRRVAVLADGFFEWRAGPGKLRTPLFFQRADGQPLAFAGLWEAWRDRSSHDHSDWLRSCTIVTTVASEDLAGTHDRMPVILESNSLDLWLDTAGPDHKEISLLLRAAPPGTLIHHPVDRRVGDVRNNWPDLIAPLARSEDAEDLTLFS